jgi:polyisoprenoid-binding protein YceI
MKKLLLLAVSAVSGFAMQAQTWSLDKSHSSVNFGIDHMVISETKGQFKGYDVQASSTAADFSDLKLTLSIDVASINTEDEGRDGHLQGADFFDAAKNPKITFVATEFKKVKGKNYILKGNLTMCGVTKPVTLACTYGGTIKDPYGKTRAGFKVTGVIDRFQFGMNYGKDQPLEGGGLAIGKDVRLSASIELVKG